MPPNHRFRTAAVVVFLAVLLPDASAQKLSFGLVAGTNLTDGFRKPEGADIQTSFYSPIIGPTIELSVSGSLSVQVSALHRYLRYDYVNLFPDDSRVPGQAKVGTWEFPILARYAITRSRLRPFMEFGPSFRAVRNKSGSDPSPYGITAGAGLEIQLQRVNISPTVRYTRWGADPPYPTLPTRRNQVELLVGISAPTTSASRELHGRKLWLALVAGIPISGDFHSPGSPTFTGTATRTFDVPFVAGLGTELELTERLALEVNGLYRRLRFDDGPEVVVTWQIPVLAKYRFRAAKVKPFVEAGPSFRLTGNLNNSNPARYGITFGIGMDTYLRRLKIAPTLRYTRWAADGRSFAPSTQALTKRDQVELLVGFSF